MIWIILSSFAMGAGVGVAGCYSYRDFMVIATNAKLAVENNHLTDVVSADTRETTDHGNPGLWSLVFPRRDGTGVARDHHTQCVELRLIERDELKAEVERLLREVWRLDAELNGEHGQRAQRYEAELDNQRLRAELMIVTADRDTILAIFAKPMEPLGDSVRQRCTCKHDVSNGSGHTDGCPCDSAPSADTRETTVKL